MKKIIIIVVAVVCGGMILAHLVHMRMQGGGHEGHEAHPANE